MSETHKYGEVPQEEAEAREKLYDELIAPELARLAKLAVEHGMGFFALVDYTGNGNIGRTEMNAQDNPLLHYSSALARTDKGTGVPNIDSFMLYVLKNVGSKNHGSLILGKLMRES